MGGRPIQIEDLLRIRFPHGAAVAPDGSRAVFALGRLEHEANEIRAHLWMVPLGRDGPAAEPTPFTADEGRDAGPRWSPDGRWIAFLSNRSGRRRGKKKALMQLWVIPAQGGEARQLTFFKEGVSQPAWAPDGRTLAFVTRGSPQRREDGPDEDDELVVREIRRVKYKFDAMGFLDGYAHVWAVGVEGGDPARVTSGDFDHEFPAWLPGGREIVCVTNRSPDADLSFVRDLWAVDVGSGALRQVTHNTGPCVSPAPSPDGEWIAYVGHDFHAGSATNMAIWVVPAAGGTSQNLTAAFDRSVGNAVGSDVRIAPLFPSVAWTADGRGLLFLATDAGRTHLHRVEVAERRVRRLTDGAEVVADFGAAGGRVVYQRITPTTLDELWVLDEAAGAAPAPLTRTNEFLHAELDVPEPERFTYNGADGWAMDGWILRPPGFDPERRYPVVLRIHGGPHAAYGDAFAHYPFVLAAHGYVVVWTNPRGSQGYGEAFTRAVVEDWGGRDSQDILLGLDAAIARGGMDPERAAVTGGSYGGFMTNWLITHIPRFRCAVTEVCVSNLHNFYGTSDIGATWGEAEWGATPWDDPDKLLAHSPIAFVSNVTTPVLITANEADHRCPIEQSEQFFIALKKLGKEAVFLRFQGESHTMGSAGRPKPRIERLRRLTAWFDAYLQPPQPAPQPGPVPAARAAEPVPGA